MGRGRQKGLAFAFWLASIGAAFGENCAQDHVDLRGDFGTVRFSVEIADDPVEQGVGLMNRPSMPQFSGMLFVYSDVSEVAFWMKNTLIPLDMLFIDETGVVQRIHENAVPLDLTSIPAGSPVLAVLEINGGLSAKLGITEGSELRHPAFAGYGPAWPCENQP
ncbi:DUF192 domain-containing protein [Algirhabdus cladophorae]|uniref:DUF192 domain-containing protein n=1 Tax=Algirhabdus cladophorae TaxID=3377108 RepID=UPI003B84A7B0